MTGKVVWTCEIHWLAGLLEGEGSFMAGPPSAPNRPRITVTMTDEDVIARIADLWDQSYFPEKPRPGRKPTYRVALRGQRAVALMKELRPLMGERRQSQIAAALSSYTPPTTGGTTDAP